jgi:hypothetical protein
MGTKSPPILHRKGDHRMQPAMDLGHRTFRGLVGVELSVLHKLRRIPRDLPSLPLPRVPLQCGYHPVQQEMAAWGVVVQEYNIPRPSHVGPPAKSTCLCQCRRGRDPRLLEHLL